MAYHGIALRPGLFARRHIGRRQQQAAFSVDMNLLHNRISRPLRSGTRLTGNPQSNDRSQPDKNRNGTLRNHAQNSSTDPEKHRPARAKFARHRLLILPATLYAGNMYEDFHVTDRWTGEDLHCRWKANIVAIATRHADAVDIRFDVNVKPMWIAMPCHAWVEQKKRTGKVITDYLAAQIAGHYLKAIIEEGYDASRQMYTMSVEEVLEHLEAILVEARQTHSIPALPILDGITQSESYIPSPSRE